MRGLYPFPLAHWRAHWRLLTTSGAGFLMVALLLASTPFYLVTSREASIRFELEQRLLEDLDIHLVVLFRPMERQTYDGVDQLVQAAVNDNLDWMVRSVVQYGNTRELFLILPGAPPQIQPNTPRVTLQFLQGMEEHTEVVDGQWWPLGDTPEPSDIIEVVLGAEAAALLELQVDDQITIIPSPQDTSRRASATIVGLVEPINPRAEYWLGYDRFSLQTLGPMAPPAVSLFVNQQSFLDSLGQALAPETANYWWFLYIRPDRLTTETIPVAAEAIERLQNRVSSAYPRATAFTALDLAFARHHARELLTSAPHRLLLTLSLGVALLYLLITGAILAERQRRTLTLLRSRGATTTHLLLPLALEATGLALLSLAVAPPLASLILTGQLVTPLEALTGGDLPLTLPLGTSYLLVAGGLAFGLLAFLSPAFAFGRLTSIRIRQTMSRPQGSLLVFRLYLDIFLLVVGGTLAWEFSRSEGAVTRSLLGPPTENPLLVGAPLLLLIGAALLFLRLLPLAVRVAGAFLTPITPSWVSLGLWMLGRHPSSPVRLALLLTVATGTVVVATAVAPTLASSIGEASLGEATAPIIPPSPDPVLVISLEAFSQLAILAVTLLTSLGALLAGQAVLQERFVQVGVLQAIGMSQREVARWLVLEHLLVLIAALLVGAWLGYQVSLWTLPLLDVGVSNPFIVQITQIETGWLGVVGFAVVVALALLVPLILSLGAVRRSALEAGLRLGEEV